MDESPYPSGSQDIYARHNHAARDLSNLMDQSLDFRSGSGTGVEDEDDFESQKAGSSTRTVAPAHDANHKGKQRSNGDIVEVEGDGSGRAGPQASEGDNRQGHAHDADHQTPQQNHENDLPTEPPLTARERRERDLTAERDALAASNTMLERALQSLESAMPAVAVGRSGPIPRIAVF